MTEQIKPSEAQTTPWVKFSQDDLDMAAAYLKDDVLAKLVDAFYEARDKEGWTRRDIAGILGCDETQISHILSGRRTNLTLASIATLAKALRKRAELTLVDVRPQRNQFRRPSILPSEISDHGRADIATARGGTLGSGKRVEGNVSSAQQLATPPYLNASHDQGYRRAAPVEKRMPASAAEGIEQ